MTPYPQLGLPAAAFALQMLAFPCMGSIVSMAGQGVVALSAPKGAAKSGASEVNYNQWLATSFVSDACASTLLADAISMAIEYVQPNQNYFLAIVGTTAGRPDLGNVRALADTTPAYWGAPQGFSQLVEFKFKTDGTRQVLLPSERYWVVLGATNPDLDSPNPAGLYRWSFLDSPVPVVSHDGWSVSNVTATGNTAGQNWSVETNTPFGFSLTLVNAVPEPASAGLGIAAGFLFLILRRR
jgi:hypothetical protein